MRELFPPPFSSNWIYGVDGKWLKRQGVFILHRDITHRINLYWSFHPAESYLALETDLKQLVKLLGKNIPKGAVSDWKGAIVGNVNRYFGTIPHQRCLAHVVRQAKLLLPKKGPFPATLELRQIAKELIETKNEQAMTAWFTKLGLWHDRNGWMLKVRTKGEKSQRRWWYTHGNLRRAWRLLSKDTEPFFEYLTLSVLPHSNNSLEGSFSQAVRKLHSHRGMKVNQQVSYLNWYFTFSRVKKEKDLKILWDYWRQLK